MVAHPVKQVMARLLQLDILDRFRASQSCCRTGLYAADIKEDDRNMDGYYTLQGEREREREGGR